MIKKFTYFLILISLFSCVTSKRINYLQDFSKKSSDTTQVYSLDTYKLQRGDRVYIKISTLDKESKELFAGGISTDMFYGNNVPEIYSYTIFNDGNIVFPFIGDVKIAGLSTRQAKDSIQSRLKPLIPDCDIDVRLINAYFTVIGNAGNGRFDISKERLNIFQALSLSGDLKSFSDRTKLHVLRKDSTGKTQIIVLDVRSKDIMNSPYFYVQPNDIIYVQSFNGQFFGMESLSSVIGSISSTFSLGYLLYYYVSPELTK